MIKLLAPRRSKKFANESNSQFLVPPEPEKEKFGIQEIAVAFLFALFVAGVHFIQFNHSKKESAYIESQVKQIASGLAAPLDSAKLQEKIQQLYPEAPKHRASGDFRLYFVFGASIFFLTATVLFFFNYEINKISLFLTEVTKQIVYIYLSAMAVIVLIVHLLPRSQGIIATHLMLMALCAAETIINRIIAASFEEVGEHYRELAKIFRLAMYSSLALLALNFYVVVQELLWEKSHWDLPIINPYGWNLGIPVALQFIAMVVIRDLIREGKSRALFENVRMALPQTGLVEKGEVADDV